MNDVANDWNTTGFTKVWAVNSTDCGLDAEEVYSRLYFGTSLGCDCLGIHSQYITGDNTMVWGHACDHNQTRYGCQTAPPVWPIMQSQFNGTRICGIPDAPKFIDAIRLPESSFEICPSGTYRCSNLTSVENTICVSDHDECPVTFMTLLQWNSSTLAEYEKANANYAQNHPSKKSNATN